MSLVRAKEAFCAKEFAFLRDEVTDNLLGR